MKFSIVFFLMLMISSSCGISRLTERTVTIVNESNADLENIIIQSSWIHEYNSQAKNTIDPIIIERLETGEKLEILLKSEINRSCLSLTSETLVLPIKDCIEENLVSSDSFEIIINEESLSITIN